MAKRTAPARSGLKQGAADNTGANSTSRLVMVVAAALVVVAVVALVAQTGKADAAAVPPGTVALPDVGGVQRLDVTAQNYFSPAEFAAKSTAPIELSFGPGTGCSQSVVIPSLGVNQDIRNGGVVKLAAGVKPGKYDIFCQLNMDMGTLYVR